VRPGVNRPLEASVRLKSLAPASLDRIVALPQIPQKDLLQHISVTLVIVPLAAIGLLVVAGADALGWRGTPHAADLFWLGLLLIWLPASAVVMSERSTREERIVAVVAVGMSLFLVHLLHSPVRFSGFDEFLHWDTANKMVQTGKLFNANQVLPVSPLYPGLEIVTAALVKLTGLSVFVAGTVVVGTARLVTILALYLLYELVGKSARLAAIATLFYAANPSFLSFSSAYVYESLAISLAIFVLYLVAFGLHRGSPRDLPVVWLAAAGPLVATAVTHHVTSFFLASFLLVLALVAPAWRRVFLWCVGLVGAAVVVLWLVLVASRVIGYLQPVATGVSEVLSLIRSDRTSRHLFENFGTQRVSAADKAGGYEFGALTMALLLLGWWHIWRTGKLIGPRAAFVRAFVLLAIAYPCSLVFRFTPVGAVLAGRLSPFVFLGVGFCAAVAISESTVLRRLRLGTLVGIAVLLAYGGVVVGSPSWNRLPGPYLVSADDRSIEPQGIDAARWARRVLGPGKRIAADRVNTVLMLTYGRETPVWLSSEPVNFAPVFFDTHLTARDRSLLRRAAIHYLVVDSRLTTALPTTGVYIDLNEPGALHHKRPLPKAAVTKFERAKHLSRVFDTGSIAIYDVSNLGP
jgi:hypothetical protein